MFIIFLLLAVLYRISAEALSTGENVALFVERMIGDYDIMIFAKSYCPYCKRARHTFDKVLKDLGFDKDKLEFHVVELDLLPDNDGLLIQNRLMDLSGQRTVPNIFIGGIHIGGNSDVEDLLFDGELHKLLEVTAA